MRPAKLPSPIEPIPEVMIMTPRRREIEVPTQPGALERREFLRRLLMGGLGLPLIGGGLLSGCGGDGAPVPPAGDLGNEVADTRDLIGLVVDTIRALQDVDDADLDGWMGQINARLGVVWPLMVAAPQADLRATVSPDMATVLAQLDGLSQELSYTGPAPGLSRARLQTAWDRAGAITGLGVAPVAPSGVSGQTMWIFLFMLFLLFPTLSDADAASYAADAGLRDTAGRAEELYGLLHPTGSVACTPCLFSGMMSRIAGLYLFLYLGMASQAAHEAGLLFGPEWLFAMVLMAALLFLNFA